MSRSYNFTFTQNNYVDTDMVDKIPCKYIVYGKEKGESGTPHLQGAITFASQKTLSSVIKKLPGCHVEIARNIFHAVEYCKKEGDVTERGTPPVSKKEQGVKGKAYYQNILDLARADQIDQIDPEAQLRFRSAIRGERDEASKKRKLEDTEEQHLWYFGPSGSGKSRKAREEHPEAYLKMCNKWWDGYNEEETVLIEDFDKKHEILCHHLKIWGDRYPHLAEYKGGSKKIRPNKLIVTSNYHPTEIWTDSSDLEPILRRFKCVEFTLE
uniref:hypothetical protein n=1 Tax=Rheinheimera sp. TaxID=1869214 RepID=UPI004048D2CF